MRMRRNGRCPMAPPLAPPVVHCCPGAELCKFTAIRTGVAGTHDAHDDAAAAAIRVRIKAHFARQSHAASAGVSVHVFRLNVARARARVRCPASAIIKLIYSLWICQCAAECVPASACPVRYYLRYVGRPDSCAGARCIRKTDC